MSHSLSLSVNSFCGLPAFDWDGLMRSFNLFANAEMTYLHFLGLFGSVFATFWMLLVLCGYAKKQSHRFVVSQDLWATDSWKEWWWNVQNGLSVPKNLHSVDERIDGVLLLVLVVLLSKHSQVNISLLGKVHECVDAIMKNWLYRLSLMSKHSCFQSKKWLFELFHLCAVKSKFLP